MEVERQHHHRPGHLGSTIIRTGVKLDNLMQVGHNAEIGAHTVIAAQTGIAGSSKMGAHCLIGGQVGIAGHLVHGDQCARRPGGIANTSPEGTIIQGPRHPHRGVQAHVWASAGASRPLPAGPPGEGPDTGRPGRYPAARYLAGPGGPNPGPCHERLPSIP